MGLVIEKTEVAYLKSFPCIVVKKDISSHLRSCKFSDPENEVDLTLSLAPKKYQFQSKKIEKFQKYFDRCALEAQVRSS